MNKVLQTGVLPLQSKYRFNPYEMNPQKGTCLSSSIEQSSYQKIDTTQKILTFQNISDQTIIKELILKKPVNIRVCSRSFQDYSPTSYDRTLNCDPSATDVDMSVLLIGYTRTEWIIKNHFTTYWGMEGIGYISR